jgi:hypothetical protein
MGTLRIALIAGWVGSHTLAGCSSGVPTALSPTVPVAGTGAPAAHLRVTNVGTLNLSGLTVLFPDERLEFGDIPAGSSTNYQLASKGVYRYAAYQYRHHGSVITQPVIDFVGEVPMPGQAFTYSIELTGEAPPSMRIRLVATTRDQ